MTVKSLIRRATLAVLLVAPGLLLAACNSSSTSVATGTSISQANNTSAPTRSAPTSIAVPTDSAQAGGSTGDSSALQTQVTSAEATAQELSSTANSNTGQSGLDLTKVDPCSFLTADDVKSVMGDVPFAPKPQTQESYHTSCSYVEPTLEANSPRLFVALDALETWDPTRSDVEPLSGFGDGGYTHNFEGWRSLWVLRKNKAVIEMDIYPPGTEAAKQLISKVIERLP